MEKECNINEILNQGLEELVKVGTLPSLTVDEALKIAINKISQLQPGKCFCLKDLFVGWQWQHRLTKGDKLRLGIIFLEKMKSRDDVEVLGKTSSNHSMYKIKEKN